MRWAALPAVIAILASASAAAQVTPISPAVADNILEIRQRNPELRDDMFAKMGGSSVESKAFLVCFSTPFVDLGERPELRETIDFFGSEKKNAFNRKSRAAGVSWNLRYVLGGRPANFRQEARASDAQWALVFFGANDAQNQNERIYLRRLVYLIEELTEMGVVPVLGAATPRRSKTRDRWIQRFNAVTEAVAEHWLLPYVDYYDAMRELPRKGLARDGVHPNVFGQGGVRAACQFTERGLRYGNNVRNLLTLQLLDQLRELAVENPTPVAYEGVGGSGGSNGANEAHASAVHSSVAFAEVDEGASTEGPIVPIVDPTTAEVDVPTQLPFSALVDKKTLTTGELPAGCGRLKPNSKVYRATVTTDEVTRIRVVALDLDGFSPRVFWIRRDLEEPRCVRRRSQALEVAARPGVWDLIVEVGEKASAEGRMLVLINRNPR